MAQFASTGGNSTLPAVPKKQLNVHSTVLDSHKPFGFYHPEQLAYSSKFAE
jgi:hypothetical protein